MFLIGVDPRLFQLIYHRRLGPDCDLVEPIEEFLDSLSFRAKPPIHFLRDKTEAIAYVPESEVSVVFPEKEAILCP